MERYEPNSFIGIPLEPLTTQYVVETVKKEEFYQRDPKLADLILRRIKKTKRYSPAMVQEFFEGLGLAPEIDFYFIGGRFNAAIPPLSFRLPYNLGHDGTWIEKGQTNENLR